MKGREGQRLAHEFHNVWGRTPARGLDLADEQEVNRVLLASGAPISEMNCLRKQI
ncbi:MAG: DUF4147 domain-containing protein, partial [Qipengyuania vulgaris]